jgi:hypothetical protein
MGHTKKIYECGCGWNHTVEDLKKYKIEGTDGYFYWIYLCPGNSEILRQRRLEPIPGWIKPEPVSQEAIEHPF